MAKITIQEALIYLKESKEDFVEEDDYVECLNEGLESLKKEIEDGEWINIDAGLLPFDYGFENTTYEDMAVDVKKVDGKYNVYFYLETENGPVEDPVESEPTYSFDTFEELERFIKNGYRE